MGYILNYKHHFLCIFLLLIFASFFYLATNQFIAGNISIYPIHALNLLREGTVYFSIDNEVFLPNSHTFLYTISLSTFFYISSLFFGNELIWDPHLINNYLKIFNLIIIFITSIIFSSFFQTSSILERLLISLLYLLTPFSLLGILSSDMDQVMTPLFLLLSLKYLLKPQAKEYLLSGSTKV